MTADPFIGGLCVGLAVAAPIGPMGVLCIQRTLSVGITAGLTTGLASATVHLIYGSAAVFGLGSAAMPLSYLHSSVLPILSAVLLFWFAAKLLFRDVQIGVIARSSSRQTISTYFSAFAIGLSNPVTLVLFAAAFPAFAVFNDRVTSASVVIGVFAGSLTWWIALSVGVACGRERLRPRTLRYANKGAGVAIALFAITTLAKNIT